MIDEEEEEDDNEDMEDIDDQAEDEENATGSEILARNRSSMCSVWYSYSISLRRGRARRSGPPTCGSR